MGLLALNEVLLNVLSEGGAWLEEVRMGVVTWEGASLSFPTLCFLAAIG